MDSLHLLVPELLEKLRVVEQKKPVNNVTTNIMRIRELIAQARSVAKKVRTDLTVLYYIIYMLYLTVIMLSCYI